MATTFWVSAEQERDDEGSAFWVLRCTQGGQVLLADVPLPRQMWLAPMSREQKAQTRQLLDQQKRMRWLAAVLILVLIMGLLVWFGHW
ncbi:MAG: hypothetical protein ACT4PP_12085 [Sporichthyaceae bacterium]